MIDVREAVEAAEEFALTAYADEPLTYLRLEEIEMNRAGDQWEVTLGWVTPEDLQRVQNTLSALTGRTEKLPRTYKTFHVDAQTGEVESMKIREV